MPLSRWQGSVPQGDAVLVGSQEFKGVLLSNLNCAAGTSDVTHTPSWVYFLICGGYIVSLVLELYRCRYDDAALPTGSAHSSQMPEQADRQLMTWTNPLAVCSHRL